MNTKSESEVYAELKEKLTVIKKINKINPNIPINSFIENVHVVDLIEIKNELEGQKKEFKHINVWMFLEENRYVVKYQPSPNVLLRIYSNFINLN